MPREEHPDLRAASTPIASNSWSTSQEKIQYGYVIKIGPGYPIPLPSDEEEPWKENHEKIKYVPLQAREGDLAIFLQKGAFEIMYESEKYFVVPQASILLLEREEDLFE
jgi:co-chaperonin GroES (HSP10)